MNVFACIRQLIVVRFSLKKIKSRKRKGMKWMHVDSNHRDDGSAGSVRVVDVDFSLFPDVIGRRFDLRNLTDCPIRAEWQQIL